MSTFYLRIEAVNLGSFIYDTQDLSTIRGASLTLIFIVEELRELITDASANVVSDFRPISTGASSGLFEFTAATRSDAEEVAKTVRTRLRRDECAKYGTFVVDLREVDPQATFGEAREWLIAHNRWRQMRQPSVAIPTWNESSMVGTNQKVTMCEKDMVRAGTQKVPFPEAKVGWCSPSVAARRGAGQVARQSRSEHAGPAQQKPIEATTGFYLRELRINELFTQDFGALSGAGADERIRQLDSKIAVIYADGNAFGHRQARMETPEELSSWDHAIKSKRRDVLRNLLTNASQDETWTIYDPTKQKDRIRFETLIWGGDDLMWVVPAWKGWETLEFFFSAEDWQYSRGADAATETEWLTHAVGIVFCHHNAPIHRITQLARTLVEDEVKPKSRTENMFAYVVLESFDHVTEGMESYWNKRLPKHLAKGNAEQKKTAREGWILAGNSMVEIRAVIRDLKEARFPRRKLYQIVRESLEDRVKAAATVADTWGALAREGAADVSDLAARVDHVFGSPDLAWFHLLELWDYVS